MNARFLFSLPLALTLTLALTACGGGGGGGTDGNPGPPAGPTPAAAGSIVYQGIRFIYVVNVATGVQTEITPLPSIKGGVSVSLDGTVAHLQEDFGNPGGVIIRLNRLDGSLVREFNVEKDFTNINNNGGARISPDGKWVAFSINTDLGGNAGRGDRTYACNTVGTVFCTFWDFRREPGWTADNRLLAVNQAQTQIYRTTASLTNTPAQNILNPIGPANLREAYSPEGTADNNGVVFSQGSITLSRTYGLNVATGVVKQLMTGGLSQRLPVAVGSSLLYQQPCCANNAGADSLSSKIHRIPLNINATIDSPTGFVNQPGNVLRFAAGELRTNERYGYTPAVR